MVSACGAPPPKPMRASEPEQDICDCCRKVTREEPCRACGIIMCWACSVRFPNSCMCIPPVDMFQPEPLVNEAQQAQPMM